MQVNIYQDEDGARKEEIAALRGDNVFGNFYDHLKEVRDYHRRFATDDLTGPEDDSALLGMTPPLSFSGEEGMGRFLDLHEHYSTWVNSKFGGQTDYQSYVAALPAHLDTVHRTQRLTKQYKQYIEALLSYLLSFHQRTQPLAPLAKQWMLLEEEFGQQWEAGEVAGWGDKGEGPAQEGTSIDLDAFNTAEELEAVGGGALKSALAGLGLKCGGTLRQRAERLMAAKGKQPGEIDPALFAKGAKPTTSFEEARQDAVSSRRSVAWIEAQIRRLCSMLSSIIEDTVGRIEKRQALTYEELEAERAELEEQDGEAPVADGVDSDEEDEYVYNPLKLPLGWDGKPIPYWLYKLHGLNMEFKCEICGGASYWGRRAFERHFTEPRHQAGMKALGIPNTKQFFEVTTIADAVALWKSIQEKQGGAATAAAVTTDEEFEDAEGNVLSSRTYMDLQRQGLL